MKRPAYETRTLPELKQHYEVEKQLASRLKTANLSERRTLYSSMYAELLQTVPLHPQHTRKADPRKAEEEAADKMCLLERFLTPSTRFLEIGAGNCCLSLRVAQRVAKAFALEVNEVVFRNVTPSNSLELVLSDGCTVPVPPGSIDVAYSYQVMEHVHPDDAREQLLNIYNALRPGGVYICVTPNRAAGPHDISQYFDPVATGFHLKEYTWSELSRLFRAVGFSKVEGYAGVKKKYFKVPLRLLCLLESVLFLLPDAIRRKAANLKGVNNLLFITAVAEK